MEEYKQYLSTHNQNEIDDEKHCTENNDDIELPIKNKNDTNVELTNVDAIVWDSTKIDNLEKLINNGVEQVIDVFEQKLLYDQSKEKQIDRLHGELQEYKRDLLAKTIKPLITGLIFMYDDMDKLVKKFETSTEELSQEKFLKILKGIREDIEILLEEHGTITFTEDGEMFNPKRQQVVQKIPTSEKEQVGNVVEHIRPGFEYGNDLIRKERVSVYIYQGNKVDEKNLTTEANISEDENTVNTEINNKEKENE